MRAWLQHYFNSWHVYCRLRLVMRPRLARAVATFWEHTNLYQFLYD
jgi:hypothetical protein